MSLDNQFLAAIAPSVLAWNPFFLTTKALWLDANDSSTLSVSNGKVSQWNDKSGNSRHVSQSSTLQQPSLATVSGRQAVTGSGSQYLLYSGSTGVDTSECTVAAVFFQDSASTTNWLGIHSAYTIGTSDTGDLGAYAMFVGNNGSSPRFAVNSIATLGTSAVPTPISIVVARRSTSGGQQHLWVNGVAMSPASVSGGAVPSGGFSVLARRSATAFGSYLDGGVNEVLSVNAAVADPVVQKIEGYLAHKWGLTGNLPVSHPYKTIAPTV